MVFFSLFTLGETTTRALEREWTIKPQWADSCGYPIRRPFGFAKSRPTTVEHVSFLGTQSRASNPGAGMGEIVPFEKVLKDGFTLIKCVKDEMYYHVDKFHQQRHAYKSAANVSIVHYDANVPKEHRKSMKPEECFKFCRTIPDMLTFGILNGRECYCAPYYKQMASDDSACDSPCVGDQTAMCGGKAKSSIYEMHMCANTEGELKDGLAALTKKTEKLSEQTTALMDVAERGGAEVTNLQKTLGIIGDPIASDNMQRAKVQAGVLLHLAEDAEKLVSKMTNAETDIATMLGSSFLQQSKAPDFTDFDVAVEAEKLIKNAKQLTKQGQGMLGRIASMFELQHELATPEGSAEAANRSHNYYDAYYFVNPEPLGANWARDKSTCGGDLAADPLFALDEDGCAYACDQQRGCKGYNWFAKGSGVCFLFTDVSKVTHYDMCSKALEGECAPSPVIDQTASTAEGDESMLQEEATSVPFPFKVKSLEPNATLFSESVQGMCTEVHGCGMGETLWDCSLMSSYECKGAIRGAKIEEEDGGLAMSFSGSVARGTRDSSCHVNPEPCVACKKYSTCAGPYLETDSVKIKKGDVASYTWTSSGAVDSYEVFVGLYSSTCGLVDYQFQRGASQPLQTFELFAPKTDEYYMKFMLGSYDGTGGGAVGADMKVRDVKQTKASVPRIVDVFAKCKLKFSEYQGLSLKPDESGKCEQCLSAATKRCLKPDGSFPVPEKEESESSE